MRSSPTLRSGRRRGVLSLVGLAALWVAACTPEGDPYPPGDTDAVTPPGTDAAPDAGTDALPPPPPPPPLKGDVWAHSSSTLYRIIDGTLTPFEVGPLSGCGSTTDIAVSRGGEVFAIGYDDLYAVQENTGACTHIASLQFGGINALTFAPSSPDDPASPEVLYAMGGGDVYVVDEQTGAMSVVADLGPSFASAGDIVWVPGVGLLGAALNADPGTWLLHVDPQTGTSTVIGNTLDGTLGLAMRDGILLGFSGSGGIAVIDPVTGSTVEIEKTNISFWGAGAAM